MFLRHRAFKALASIFGVAICVASTHATEIGGAATEGAAKPRSSSSSLLADVSLDDVLVSRALKLLAEIYDVSISSGQLPEIEVTMRLRAVSVEEAFDALAAAAGLDVRRQGKVFLVSPQTESAATSKILVASLPPQVATHLDWLDAAGVETQAIGPEEWLLEGSDTTLAAVSDALLKMRQAATIDRIFQLGVASGETVLMAIKPLLDEDIEQATYDATGHLLTVSALPSSMDRIEALLEELSRPPTQYEIEVKVIEVSRRALERLGAQGSFRLDIRGGVLASTFPFSGLDDSARYFPSVDDLADLGSTATGGGSGFSDGGDPSGGIPFRFGRVDARGISLLIEFLENSGEARVMATPKVTALDNRQAQISMVTTLRIPTFTQNEAFGTTTVSGIEEVEVGTTLEVRPRKSDDGQILLTVIPEVSELEPTSEVFSQNGLVQGLPVITRRRTHTEVLLESGETLVIGGLVTERQIKTEGKTPGLGDLPLIGRAFRLKGESNDSSELLVFVTPRELPPAEERRAKIRIDDVWIPSGLATQVDTARNLIEHPRVAARVTGVRNLERIDSQLRQEGLDVGPDVMALGGDSNLEVRVAAGLFLLHNRPAHALNALVGFADSRQVALAALALPLAPHLRAALAEIVERSDQGGALLAQHFMAKVESGDHVAARHLLEALIATPSALSRLTLVPELAMALEDIPPLAEALSMATTRLDALSAVPERAADLAQRAMDGESRELRAFALAALVRALGDRGTAELLSGRSSLRLSDSSKQRLQALEPYATASLTTEPALAWSGVPAEVEILGDSASGARVQEGLDLLAKRAPDLRHFVGFALATIEAVAEGPAIDPVSRRAQINFDDEADHLAHQLVRLATIVFEARVRGFPATGGRALARGVREEIRALERLTGAPCSPLEADALVQQVLTAADLGGEDDA